LSETVFDANVSMFAVRFTEPMTPPVASNENVPSPGCVPLGTTVTEPVSVLPCVNVTFAGVSPGVSGSATPNKLAESVKV
jgi:hypothetical protein